MKRSVSVGLRPNRVPEVWSVKQYSARIKQLELFSNRKSIINCLKARSH